MDALLYTDTPGRLMGGFTVQQGMSSAHVQSVWGNGKLQTGAIGVGGTLTWIGSNGIYFDGQAQVNWFDTDIRSRAARMRSATASASRPASGLPPAAVVIHATGAARLHARRLTLERMVFSKDGDSLLGRVGLALDYRIAVGATRSNIYGIDNLYHEFLDGTSVDVGGVRFRSEPDQLWGGLGLGGSYGWGADKYALFSEISVNTGLENFGDSHSVNGRAGFRMRW